jgi:hypothetical protein
MPNKALHRDGNFRIVKKLIRQKISMDEWHLLNPGRAEFIRPMMRVIPLLVE